MSRTLQARVVALAGAGVAVAAALFAVLTDSTITSLNDVAARQRARAAEAVAREISRELSDDLRVLAGIGGTDGDTQRMVLESAVRAGHLADAAFVLSPDGAPAICVPASRCDALDAAAVATIASPSIQLQRPVISSRLPDGSILAVVPFRMHTPEAAAAGFVSDGADGPLTDALEPLRDPPHGRAALVDAEGKVIAGDTDVGGDAAMTTSVEGTSWRIRATAGAESAAIVSGLRRRSIVFAASLAAVAMFFAWGVGRSVRRPLVNLTAAAERISSGDLSSPIEERLSRQGGQEIARLAAALERMRHSLLASIVELELRVAERTRALADANLRLEERERVRRHLLRRLISAQEDERKRVARELHDELSQLVAALGLAAEVAGVHDVRVLVDRMSDELHRLIVDLRPSVLDDLGLASAIRWCAERHLSARGIAVRCEIDDLPASLPPEVETALFRAVQEAIVNIERHAGAEMALIQMSMDGQTLVVEIEDDGAGFDPTGVGRDPGSLRGVGLLGMRERIEIVDGSLSVESEPGNGTRVVMRVPLQGPAVDRPLLHEEVAHAGAPHPDR